MKVRIEAEPREVLQGFTDLGVLCDQSPPCLHQGRGLVVAIIGVDAP